MLQDDDSLPEGHGGSVAADNGTVGSHKASTPTNSLDHGQVAAAATPSDTPAVRAAREAMTPPSAQAPSPPRAAVKPMPFDRDDAEVGRHLAALEDDGNGPASTTTGNGPSLTEATASSHKVPPVADTAAADRSTAASAVAASVPAGLVVISDAGGYVPAEALPGGGVEVNKAAPYEKIKDGLKDVVPDVVQNAFSKVTNIAGKSRAAIAEAMPQQVTVAASAMGRGVAKGAATAGALINNAGDRILDGIPDAVMSKELKTLIFTDFNNTIRCFLHTNVLAFPYIVSEAGLLGGVILTVCLSLVCEHTTELFLLAKNSLPNRNNMFVYGEVPRGIWGQWYPTVNVFHGVIHLLSFVVFAGHNFQVITGQFVDPADSYFWGMVIPLLIAAPFLIIKDATHLRPLATVANFAMLIALCLLIGAISSEQPADPSEIDFYPKTQVAVPQQVTSGTIATVTSLFYVDTAKQRWAVALGLLVYALSGIGGVITVERTMVDRPGLYIRLLRTAFAVTLLVLLGFGISGYYSSGRGTCAVYTLSLDPGPLRNTISVVLFVASICIIPQQLFPFAEVIDRRFLGLKGQLPYFTTTPNVVRLLVVAACAIVGYNVPFYGLICAFGGALGCGLLQLMVPSAMEVTLVVRQVEATNSSLLSQELSSPPAVPPAAAASAGAPVPETVVLSSASASSPAVSQQAAGGHHSSAHRSAAQVAVAAGAKAADAAAAVASFAQKGAANVVSWQGRLLKAIPYMTWGQRATTLKDVLIFAFGFFTFFVSTFFVLQDIMQKVHLINVNQPHSADVQHGHKCY